MSSRSINVVESAHELLALQEEWDALEFDSPFMEFGWLCSWWLQIGGNGSLYVVTSRDESGQLVLIAPWYLHQSRTRGTEIRFLGSGKICSDYSSLAVHTDSNPAEEVAALVEWLRQRSDWKCINLEGCAKSDSHIGLFVRLMADRGYQFFGKQEESFWRLQLPNSYSEFVSTRPKKTRQKLRKVERESFPDSEFELCTEQRDLDSYLHDFKLMHMARHRELHGHDGCFEDLSFDAFLKSNLARLLSEQRLWFGRLRIDGQVAASCIAMQRHDILYYYQTAFDPKLFAHQPGWIQNIHLIQNCIAQRVSAIDFLRGDEPYKARLGAEACPHERLRTVANTPAAQLRFGVWSALHTLKNSMPSGQD
ncbi:MAG: GNAT family N-acetyltransferase [Planctomycetota bacterium]